MTKRDYEADEIRVHWDSSRCIHTGICLRTLPGVFDRERRPWVDIEGASAQEIAATVALCPSGALGYTLADGSAEVPDEPTTVAPRPNGPYAVRGDIEITGVNGEILGRGTRFTLCRCGASENKPFCDTSHRTIGFEAP